MRTQADASLVRARRILRSHKERAKKDGAKLDYGLDEILTLIGCEFLCEYCAQPVGWDLQIDHMMPTSRGGKHALANLAVSCERCNQLKGQLTREEFVQLHGLLLGLCPAARQDIERRLIAGGKRYR